jgi:hypothetical protein
MKLHLALAAMAAITSVSFLATGADAAEPVIAKLQTPVVEKTKVIAGGAVFLCEGDACITTGPTSRTIATASCKELVKTVGAVSTFGAERKQLAADRLEACNAVAATPTQLANR